MALRVLTDIPYGNAADVEIAEEGDFLEVSFTPHPHGGPECLWFCLRIEGSGGEPVRLRLKNAQNMLGGSMPETMRPVIRRPAADWERLGPGTAAPLPDGRTDVTWEIAAPNPWADVAYCYPYGRPDIEALQGETDGYWQADTIGVSQQGRPLVRLSNDCGEPEGERPGLYLIARQHSGETPGSWVLDGLLRELARGDDAPLVWAVPLSNIDGVEGGDYGKDNFPYDLNRAWGAPAMRHETLVIQRDLARWRQRCRPALAADFHAPGVCESDGIYCYLPHPEHCPEQHAPSAAWAAAVAAALTDEYASDDFGRVAGYASRWETPSFTRHCAGALGVPAFTLETPYALAGDLLLTRERYQEAGRRTGQAMAAHLEGLRP